MVGYQVYNLEHLYKQNHPAIIENIYINIKS
jgi:hypothetical protein